MMELSSLWQRIRQRVPLSRLFQAAILLLFAGYVVFFLQKYWQNIDFSLILRFWKQSLAIFGLAILFLGIKSCILYLGGVLFGKRQRYFHYLKVYCVSLFVELATFSGKLGADGFKLVFWKDISVKQRFLLVFLLRGVDIFAFITLFLLFYFSAAVSLSFVVTGLLLFFTLDKWQRRHSPEQKISLFRHPTLYLMLFLSLISFGIMLLQLSIVFSAVGLLISKETLLSFLASHGLGALSQLPLGLGAKDFSLFYLLRESLPVETILFSLIWVRLFSDFFVFCLGGLFSLLYLRRKQKETQKESIASGSRF